MIETMRSRLDAIGRAVTAWLDGVVGPGDDRRGRGQRVLVPIPVRADRSR